MLGKTIGEGTFGKVKLGFHTLTNERVAKIKISMFISFGSKGCNQNSREKKNNRQSGYGTFGSWDQYFEDFATS